MRLMHKPKVLLIEDDAALGYVLKQQLKNAGYQADLESNGKEGLEKLGQNHYDILIADIGLPGINGIEVIKKLRSEEVNIPTIVITSHTDIQSQLDAFNVGTNIFHNKPLNYELLFAQLKSLTSTFGIKPMVSLEGFNLDMNKRELAYSTKVLSLSKSEASLLRLLLTNPQKTYSRSELVNHINLGRRDKLEGSVDNLVSRLRSKMRAKEMPVLISTIYGAGFRVAKVSGGSV